jgi:hypothetical protein
MLFVIKSSLFQLQLKDAWAQRETTMDEMREEIDGMRAALSDRQWLGEVESRVRAAPKAAEGVLYAEIAAKLVRNLQSTIIFDHLPRVLVRNLLACAHAFTLCFKTLTRTYSNRHWQ